MWKTITTIVSIVQIIVSIVLIASVLMQSAKKEGMAGIVGGASETFFGKNKGRTLDSKFAVVTTACAIIFLISSLVLSYGFVAVENQNAKSQEEVNTETTDDKTVVPEATVPNDMVDITTPEGAETAPESAETAPESTEAVPAE